MRTLVYAQKLRSFENIDFFNGLLGCICKVMKGMLSLWCGVAGMALVSGGLVAWVSLSGGEK